MGFRVAAWMRHRHALAACLAAAVLFGFAAGVPVPGGRIFAAVANRGAGTVTAIDKFNESKTDATIGGASEPMYLNQPIGTEECWVVDRNASQMVILSACNMSELGRVPIGAGGFHAWSNPNTPGEQGQLWVAGDIDKDLTVIDVANRSVLAKITIPEDLKSDFKPHDVTVAADGGIMTLLAIDEEKTSDGWVLKYDAETFELVARVRVGGDPHVYHLDGDLFIVTQRDGKVTRADPRDLSLYNDISIPGAHGVWGSLDRSTLWVANIESEDGVGALYTLQLPNLTNAPGSPTDTLLSMPHNLLVPWNSQDKLFITHSATESVTVYDLDDYNVPIVPGREIVTGKVPFGIMNLDVNEECPN